MPARTMFMRQSDNHLRPFREYRCGAVRAIARRYSDQFSSVDLYVGGAFVASVSGHFAPSSALRECRIAWEGAAMDKTSEQHQIDAMASGMFMYGNQYDPDGLAAFVRDYPELAEPAHLRERAWALSVKWLDELPTRRTRR